MGGSAMSIENIIDYKPCKPQIAEHDSIKKPVYEPKLDKWKISVKYLLDGGCLMNAN